MLVDGYIQVRAEGEWQIGRDVSQEEWFRESKR